MKAELHLRLLEFAPTRFEDTRFLRVPLGYRFVPLKVNLHAVKDQSELCNNAQNRAHLR